MEIYLDIYYKYMMYEQYDGFESCFVIVGEDSFNIYRNQMTGKCDTCISLLY